MRWAAVLAVSIGLAGCGEDEAPRPDPRPAPSPPPARSETGPGAVRVVRTWVDRLRRGDVKGAARTFGLPATVQNGGDSTILRTRRDVERWLALLPCGARLVRSESRELYVLGVFRLTHRPGSRCDGPGNLAATAFLIRGGRIVEWRRVVVPAEPKPV